MAGLRPRPKSRLTLPVLVARYAAFAALATLVNLGAQRAVLHLGEGRCSMVWRWSSAPGRGWC